MLSINDVLFLVAAFVRLAGVHCVDDCFFRINISRCYKAGLALVLSCIASISLATDIEVIVHIDDAYKPYSYEENGKVKGLYSKFLMTAFSRMKGYRVTLKAIPWNRGKKLMKTGEGFALSPPYFHAHDWPYLYPYSLPYHTETVVVACVKGLLTSKKPKWPDEFMGLSIGNVLGFDGWGRDKFRQFVKEKKMSYKEIYSAELLIAMLVKERIDCILMEKLALNYYLTQYKKKLNRKIDNVTIEATVGTDFVFVGYSKKAMSSGKFPFAADFKRQLDIIFYDMIRSGEADAIIKGGVEDIDY